MPALPPATVPRAPVAEIASYATTTVWVDPARGALVRAGAVTRRLELSVNGLRDLDVGPGADGRPVAVYDRCAPSCDVYALDLASGREARVPAASRPGVSERLPTVWRGTLAFTRGDATYTARVGSAAPAKLVFTYGAAFSDLELGPTQLAFSGEYDSDDANGQTELDLVDRAHPTGKWTTIDFAYVGEGSAAGLGGVTADASGFWWQRASRNGCADPKRVFRHRRASAAAAPLAARLADPAIPDTPESEDC